MDIHQLQRRVLAARVNTIPEFIITVKTDNAGVSALNEILLPIQGTDMVIDWGDGNVTTHTQPNAPNHTIGGNNVSHGYSVSGVYQIKISPSIKSIVFNNAGDKLKLMEINNWGFAKWTNISLGFYGCSNMDMYCDDIPDFSEHESVLIALFRSCSNLTEAKNIGKWVFYLINNVNGMFQDSNFNKNINNWNTINFTNIGSMFAGNQLYNQPMNFWDASNFTLTNFFLYISNAFNQDIGGWQLNSGFQAGNNFYTIFDSNAGINTQEGYSRTLIGWANYVFENGFPINKTMGASNRRYNSIVYTLGQTFNDAVSARSYLTGTAGWTITGDAII